MRGETLDLDRLITIEVIAEALGTDVRNVKLWAKNKNVDYFRAGNQWLFTPEQAKALLAPAKPRPASVPAQRVAGADPRAALRERAQRRIDRAG